MVTKYDFQRIEESTLKFWEENGIYRKAKEKNKGKRRFTFLQGPPYTSGRLHAGHAWNNSMKDIILRYKRLKGFDVWDRGGYDMHGLPTENAVAKQLGLKTKEDILSYGVDKFVKKCRELCVANAEQMNKDLTRLAVWLDHENAYWPIRNEYVEGEWWFVKKAFEAGRLYRGKKVMTWCASCETALAKHELEYKELSDDSVFLKFKVKGKEDEYLIVWTTTPWTIPYNIAVMVNPELDYVRAKVGEQTWVVAKALVGPLISGVAGKPFEIIEEFKGEKLEGLKYEHVFYSDLPVYKELEQQCDRCFTVLLSKEYVDTSAGSGLVHAASGCGPEDQEVCAKYGIPAFNRLDERGVFRDMGLFDGWKAKSDDKKFIEVFKQKGFLIESTKVEHDYAHCWRCKNPVVFRTTDQWFLKVEDLRDTLREQNKSINWVPKNGEGQFDSWLRHLKDNSIGRQRFWGAPLPIWQCECGKMEVIGSRDELSKLATTELPDDLHKPWIDGVKLKCECGKEMTRDPDVLDVWIDAGTAAWNCFYFPEREDLFEKWFPADFILEATEQVRLWFSILHICSNVALGKPAFKNVYMHGMLLDYQGVKMSKSLGNVLSPYEVIDKFGVDVLRFYVCQVNAGENINFSWDDIKNKQRSMMVLWNLHTFVLNYAKEIGVNPEGLDRVGMESAFGLEEKYILSRLNSSAREVSELLDSYHLDEPIDKLEQLFLDLSRTYVQLVREKMVFGSQREKKAVLYVLYSSLMTTLRMFQVIAPLICERIYQDFKEAFGSDSLSVTLLDWPEADETLIDEKFEERFAVFKDMVAAALHAREKAQIGVRWPLGTLHVVARTSVAREAAKECAELIKTQVNVKQVQAHEYLPQGVQEKVAMDTSAIQKDFESKSPAVLARLALENLKTVWDEVKMKGKYSLAVENERVDVLGRHLLITRDMPSNLVEAQFRSGLVYLDTERDEDLWAEGYSREVMRRVQVARKRAGLSKLDKVSLFLKVPEEMESMLLSHVTAMKLKCGAEALKVSTLDPAKEHDHHSVEKIKGHRIELFFSKER